MKIMEDKLFQNLAVTSQKWLNIKEVNFKHMKNYLLEMKCSGYTLIGIEQTANSVPLNKYAFPKKSILILG
jgi:tRNA guanosine-2'-O-methyltransferase